MVRVSVCEVVLGAKVLPLFEKVQEALAARTGAIEPVIV